MVWILLIELLVSKSLSGSVRLFFIFAFTFVLTGCPGNKGSNDGKNTPSSAIDPGKEQNGGYDWGGGGAIKSSPELVKRTIELAQVFAGEQNINRNIYRQFLTWTITTTADNQRFDTSLLFPNSGNGLNADTEFLTNSPALKAISQKKIKLLESGDCPRPATERIADASVSKHNLSGEVCFSVGNLTRIAPTDLTRQVFGLMLHEAVHLAGGDEDLAFKFQESFNVYFGIRFGEMLGEAYMASIDPQLFDIISEFTQNRDQIRMKMPIAHIYGVYGRAYGALNKLNGVYDLTGIRLRLALKHEPAAVEFVTKIERLKDTLGKTFYLEVGLQSRPEVLSYEQLTSVNAQLEKMGKDLWESWARLEKASLCDDKGEFLYLPRTWLLQDVCKVPSH